MKNTIKVFGIAAIIAIIGFTIVTCGGDGGNGGGDGSTFLGETPTLSGQVYVQKYNEAKGTVSFQAYTGGNLTVSAVSYSYGEGGGSNGEGDNRSTGGGVSYDMGEITVRLTEKGTIKNGLFSFTLGTPTGLDNFEDIFSYMTVSPSTAKGYRLTLYIENSNNYGYLSKMNFTGNVSNYTYEEVEYVYVDKDCTISSNGETETYEGITYTTRPFNLALQTGWNTIYSKQQYTPVGSTITYSLSNPGNLKWVLTEGLEPPEVGKQEP